jgi:thymidylate synthase (FAD)
MTDNASPSPPLVFDRPALEPLGDGISRVVLLDSMGSSLSVVNDARQSFEAHSVEWTDRDQKLINFLIREHHTSPFRGTVFKWFVKAPLFICRQWWKHVVACTYVDDQLGWNEKSFRYCAADDAEYYVPDTFRKQSESNRQASEGSLSRNDQQLALRQYVQALEGCKRAYEGLLLTGVAKEQARAILPSALYSSFIWTCSLQALLHFISLRQGHGAQGEIVAYADALHTLARPVAPEAFDAFSTVPSSF